MRNFTNLFIAIIALGLSGCFLNEEASLPSGTGKSGDLVVVMDSSLWNGRSGDIVMNCLAAPQEGLPQDEPLFNVIRVLPKDFKQIFKTTKNILLIDYNSNMDKSRYSFIEDRWARDQVVMTIQGLSDQSCADILSSNCDGIIQNFQEAEVKRLQKAFNKLSDQSIGDLINENMGVHPVIPTDYSVTNESKNFIWLRKDMTHQGHQVNMGLLYSSFNYTSKLEFQTDSLITKINGILKKVNGPTDNSHMKIYEELSPAQRELNTKDTYIKELRGLWNMENAFMGGPFVTFAFVNKEGTNLILVTCYVFAPKFDKREYLRELEAIALSSVSGV